MRTYIGLLGVASLILGACAASTGDDDSSGEAVTEASFSYVGQAVLSTLRTKHADMRGRTWDFSGDNTLEPGWVLQTPLAQYWGTSAADLPIAASCDGDAGCDPDFHLYACQSQSDCTSGGTCSAVAATVSRPGQSARSLCVGHSDAMVDSYYNVIVQAKSFVDITSLSPPDGRFEAAVRNALTFLSHTGNSIRVRLLYGDIIAGGLIGAGTTPEDVVKSLSRDVDPKSGLRLAVAEYRDGFASWDHAKIVSVDGGLAIVGGHNMWSKHYLDKNPVHDISMRVKGSAAAEASRFANELWSYTCGGAGLGGWTRVSDFPKGSHGCSESFAMAPRQGAGKARIVSVGRLGKIGDEASDDAIVAMVDSARSSAWLSLQDIGPPGALGIKIAAWPERYMHSLVAALGRGVDVRIVLSNKNAVPGGLNAGSASYSNGYTAADVVNKLAEYAGKHPDLLPSGTNVADLLCESLHVAPLRMGAEDAWADGATFANHAKLAIVDERAFYIGSQNWYPANLAEFGYMVDDERAAKDLVNAYYSKVWDASHRVAVSGSDAPSCALR